MILQICVTLWSTRITSFNGVKGDILVVSKEFSCRVTDYRNATKISINSISKLILNPAWEEAKSFKQCFHSEGQFQSNDNFSQQINSDKWINEDFPN